MATKKNPFYPGGFLDSVPSLSQQFGFIPMPTPINTGSVDDRFRGVPSMFFPITREPVTSNFISQKPYVDPIADETRQLFRAQAEAEALRKNAEAEALRQRAELVADDARRYRKQLLLQALGPGVMKFLSGSSTPSNLPAFQEMFMNQYGLARQAQSEALAGRTLADAEMTGLRDVAERSGSLEASRLTNEAAYNDALGQEKTRVENRREIRDSDFANELDARGQLQGSALFEREELDAANMRNYRNAAAEYQRAAARAQELELLMKGSGSQLFHNAAKQIWDQFTNFIDLTKKFRDSGLGIFGGEPRGRNTKLETEMKTERSRFLGLKETLDRTYNFAIRNTFDERERQVIESAYGFLNRELDKIIDTRASEGDITDAYLDDWLRLREQTSMVNPQEAMSSQGTVIRPSGPDSAPIVPEEDALNRFYKFKATD